jgi:hypothetical protein
MALSDLLQNPNSIAVSTSTQVFVKNAAGGLVFIGVVQSLTPGQSRGTSKVRGIGTGDSIIDHVWQLSEYTLSVSRLAVFGNFLWSALGYNANFRMLATLRQPVDFMEQIDYPDGSPARTTWYRKCYMNNYDGERSITGDIMITESATFDVTSIDDGAIFPLNGINFGL